MKEKAIYKGYLLDACERDNNNILVWGIDKELLKLNFNEDVDDENFITYDKIISKYDLDELYEITEYVTWHDKEFLVFGETEDTYTLYYSYMDMDKTRDMLGFCRYYEFETYDKNVYVKSVPKKEITNYRVEKKDLLKRKCTIRGSAN